MLERAQEAASLLRETKKDMIRRMQEIGFVRVVVSPNPLCFSNRV